MIDFEKMVQQFYSDLIVHLNSVEREREREREWRVPLYVNRFKKCGILQEHKAVLSRCTFEKTDPF